MCRTSKAELWLFNSSRKAILLADLLQLASLAEQIVSYEKNSYHDFALKIKVVVLVAYLLITLLISFTKDLRGLI
jgi:hypothetical protein